jgi:hypothetical protein
MVKTKYNKHKTQIIRKKIFKNKMYQKHLM